MGLRAHPGTRLKIFWLRARGRIRIGERARIGGRVWVHGEGRVSIGRDVVLDGTTAPIELGTSRGAVIEIHDGAQIDGGVSIESVERITVGRRAHLGAFTKVMDTHFHTAQDRTPAVLRSRPVTVGDEAEVGERSILLPGTELGTGVILLPRTVASRRVPAGVVLAGNPPRRVDAQP
jgi:acetyltransferase-like isoleucine patch superfamily enzyme